MTQNNNIQPTDSAIEDGPYRIERNQDGYEILILKAINSSDTDEKWIRYDIYEKLKAQPNAGWLPIELASKDGTHILGYASEDYTVVHWNKYGEYWNLSEVGAYAENGEWNPTHFQYLPPAPKKEG